MPEKLPRPVEISVNGNFCHGSVSGATVAVAIALAGVTCRKSVSGELRGPLCGMGIRFECRAAVDGVPFSSDLPSVAPARMEINTEY